VRKLESFGAFCSLEGFRKQGLLHLSQLSAHRVEAADLPDILSVGQDVFVKVPRKSVVVSSRSAL
jgi:predicted RNA-binding protein with RPS1 domain